MQRLIAKLLYKDFKYEHWANGQETSLQLIWEAMYKVMQDLGYEPLMFEQMD